MLDYEAQRKLIVTFILAVIVVIIITIVALIFIWMPEKELEPEYEVGKISQNVVTSDNMLDNYANKIRELLVAKDVDTLYTLLSKDYIEYKKFDKVSFKKFLENKNMMGKTIEVVQYMKHTVKGYNAVYQIDLKAANEAYSLDVIIREIAPEKYTISFDKFIDYVENVQTSTVMSVKLEINSRLRLTNGVQYQLKVSNNYDKDIIINKNKSSIPVLLVNSSDYSKQPIATSIATVALKLKASEFRTFSVAFNVDSATDHSTYNLLVLRDVAFGDSIGAQDIEFKLD